MDVWAFSHPKTAMSKVRSFWRSGHVANIFLALLWPSVWKVLPSCFAIYGCYLLKSSFMKTCQILWGKLEPWSILVLAHYCRLLRLLMKAPILVSVLLAKFSLGLMFSELIQFVLRPNHSYLPFEIHISIFDNNNIRFKEACVWAEILFAFSNPYFYLIITISM